MGRMGENKHEELGKEKRPELFKNLAVASALAVCAVTLRCGAIPDLQQASDAVISVVTEDTLLDDRLGKLSFVSALFPEAVQVFGAHHAAPVEPIPSGEVIHTWSEAEPYMAWHAAQRLPVYAVLEGEVTEVIRSPQGENRLKVLSADGRACVYGNLAETSLREGDGVQAGEPVGYVAQGTNVSFELLEAGRSVSPALWQNW